MHPDLNNPLRRIGRFARLCQWILLATLLCAGVNCFPADVPVWKLVPWPKSIEVKPGAQTITMIHSRIVVNQPELRSLAVVLAEEVALCTRRRYPIVTGEPKAGDIVLRLDPAYLNEAYSLDAEKYVQISGGNYRAVALGTATFLQLLPSLNGSCTVFPQVTIKDEPATEFRGLLVDVARRYHSIENLKQMVTLCRLYKIRYLQLHLTDDQSFMFPSTAYPQLSTKNQHGGKTYTLEELRDLVAFADARNVTIIPEYEVPGHSAAANRAMPDLFLIKGTKPYEHHASINFAKDEVMKAVSTIVGEMCDVFKSSPYFHIGGDEADLAFANQNEDFKAAFKKHTLPNQHQLYRKFVVDMNEIVKKHGKKTIVWEGFGRESRSPIQIPNDIIVMAYEIRFYMPDHLVRDGYQVINASWTPLYVVNRGRPPEEIYAWNLHQFKPYGARPAERGVIVPPEQKVFGAQMCAWEQPEQVELPSLRHRLPAMAERIWNPNACQSYEQFAGRAESTDRLLDLLVHQFTVRAEGLINPTENRFNQTLQLRLSFASDAAPEGQSADFAKRTIRYTRDGTEPNASTPAYKEPIQITNTTDFRARAFDENGKALGYPCRIRYEFHPVSGLAKGILPDERFSGTQVLTLQSSAPGDIHYTLDGKEPKTNSPAYSAPIIFDKSVKVKAALFRDGKKLGESWSQDYTLLNSRR